MKKIISLLLAGVLCLTFAACGGESEDNGRTKAEEHVFELAENEEKFIENLIFTEDVTISGDYAVIAFSNCEFKGDIINTAELATRVILEKSEVEGKCVLRNTEKEATIETPLPKFIVDSSVEVAFEDCIGSAVAMGDFALTVNGKTYKMSDSTVFFDGANPDQGFVDYNGQEASVFYVAQWWENGEYIEFAGAEFDPNM